jgi:phage terminase large subunit
MRDLGMPVAISPKLSIQDGIQAVRALLIEGLTFHKTNCQKGIDALEQYRREYDEETKTFKQKPEHDWSSHYSDAFRYLALSIRIATGMTNSYESKRLAPASTDAPKIILPTLDDMWKLHDKDMARQRAGGRI